MEMAKQDTNRLTITACDTCWQEYIDNTPTDIQPVRDWLDLAVADLAPASQIFEFGSGSGRDAHHLASLGYQIDCSDATPAFVDYLRRSGFAGARLFNAISDQFPPDRDLILANGVLHHFNRQQAQLVIAKAYQALQPGGRFGFTLKEGQGEGIYHDKLSLPRYAHHWPRNEIAEVLKAAGFAKTTTLEDISYKSVAWLSIVSYKPPLKEA